MNLIYFHDNSVSIYTLSPLVIIYGHLHFNSLHCLITLFLSADDLQTEIVQSCLNYSGFVDANSLLYIWPREMQRCRICLISGDLKKPIFCTFFPSNVSNVDALDDVIIHSDGSHFTLLKPAVAENSNSFSVRSSIAVLLLYGYPMVFLAVLRLCSL